MRTKPTLTGLLGAALCLGATVCLSQPDEIGKAITVVPSVESDTAGKIIELEPGSNIFQDDEIRTYRIGAAGLRFVDQTTLTVYPNTSIKLDRYVYNPDRTISDVALNLLKGAFRLASGGPRTSERYSLKTPHVTLGIRGTVLHVVADEGSSIVQALHGAFEGCSVVSGICKFVRATDVLNGARFWKDGRVELGRFDPDLGVRRPGSGSLTASQASESPISGVDVAVPSSSSGSTQRSASGSGSGTGNGGFGSAERGGGSATSVAVPGPVVGAGLPVLIVGALYLFIRTRRKTAAPKMR
jgi:hypothetical protein